MPFRDKVGILQWLPVRKKPVWTAGNTGRYELSCRTWEARLFLHVTVDFVKQSIMFVHTEPHFQSPEHSRRCLVLKIKSESVEVCLKMALTCSRVNTQKVMVVDNYVFLKSLRWSDIWIKSQLFFWPVSFGCLRNHLWRLLPGKRCTLSWLRPLPKTGNLLDLFIVELKSKRLFRFLVAKEVEHYSKAYILFFVLLNTLKVSIRISSDSKMMLGNVCKKITNRRKLHMWTFF